MHWILSQNANRKKSPNGVRQTRLRILLTTFFVHFGATFSSEDNKLLRRWTITDIGHYLFDDSWSSTNAVCRPISLHDSRWENLNLCLSVRPSVRTSSHSCIRQRSLVSLHKTKVVDVRLCNALWCSEKNLTSNVRSISFKVLRLLSANAKNS